MEFLVKWEGKCDKCGRTVKESELQPIQSAYYHCKCGFTHMHLCPECARKRPICPRCETPVKNDFDREQEYYEQTGRHLMF